MAAMQHSRPLISAFVLQDLRRIPHWQPCTSRDGFSVDLRWSAGELERAVITSLAGQPGALIYRGQKLEVKLKQSQRQAYGWVKGKLQSINT
jgi:hypothetical protein